MFQNLIKIFQDGIVLSDSENIIYSNQKIESIFEIIVDLNNDNIN